MAYRTCSIDDCEKPARVRGWCRTHYGRWQKNGDPLVTLYPTMHMTPEERYEYYVRRGEPGECWGWAGASEPTGYGKFSIGSGVIAKAHRFSYELHKGPIPEGLLIRHTCDNPPCTNPDHLLVGTYKDNARDAQERRRMAHGDNHGKRIMSEAQVREFRRLYDEGVTSTEIAKQNGLPHMAVWQAVKRINWKYVD